MLVITRKRGQAIQIGTTYVEVLSVGKTYVKLGIDAPREVNIRRTEVPESTDRTTEEGA